MNKISLALILAAAVLLGPATGVSEAAPAYGTWAYGSGNYRRMWPRLRRLLPLLLRGLWVRRLRLALRASRGQRYWWQRYYECVATELARERSAKTSCVGPRGDGAMC